MHPRIMVNNRLVETSKARLPAITAATLHGRGVFSTLAIYSGRPFLWNAHWLRLTDHAQRAGVECEFAEDDAEDALARLIKANEVDNGRARLTLLARAAHGPWHWEDGPASDLVMMTGDAPKPKDSLTLTVSPYRVNTLSPLTGIKSLNYLEHILAWEESRSRDFDEAIVLNERGEIVSATMANVFWVKQGAVHTPTLQTGALAGTTRARVMGLAGDLGIPLVESAAGVHDVAEADEIFLTSSVLGVAIVTTFDFHRYTVAAGSVTLRLREAFRQLTLKVE